jgi:hypothetical protein
MPVIGLFGAFVGLVLGILLPRLWGTARERVPRLLGVVKLTWLRAAGGAVFGLSITTAVGLVYNGHSHKTMTYALWYALAFVGFALALVSTLVIDGVIMRGRQENARPRPGGGSASSPARRPAIPSRAKRIEQSISTRQAATTALAVQTEQTEQPEGIDPKLRKWLDHERERGAEYAAHVKREGSQLLAGTNFIFALKNFGMSSMSLSSLTSRSRTWSRTIATRIEGVEGLSAHVETFRAQPPAADSDPTEGDFRRLAEYLEQRVRLLREILREPEG